MYCIKCGKQIEKGTLCNECLVAELVSEEPAKKEPVAQESTEVTPMQESTATTDAGIDTAGNFTFFNEQMNEAAPTPTFENGNTMPEPHNRMYGFGKALAATIMSAVGFIMAYVAIFVAILEPAAALVVLLLSCPLIIISFIFGIQSIKLFKARKNTCAKPIPTLVLGIESVATSGFSAFFAFIVFLVVIIAMSVG